MSIKNEPLVKLPTLAVYLLVHTICGQFLEGFTASPQLFAFYGALSFGVYLVLREHDLVF